jgi:hypothetical protein
MEFELTCLNFCSQRIPLEISVLNSDESLQNHSVNEISFRAAEACRQAALFHASMHTNYQQQHKARLLALERMRGSMGVNKMLPWTTESFVTPLQAEVPQQSAWHTAHSTQHTAHSTRIRTNVMMQQMIDSRI